MTSAARPRSSTTFADGGETTLEELGATLLMAGLEGLGPPRRPHHENEDGVVVMSRWSCCVLVSRLGGLGLNSSLIIQS